MPGVMVILPIPFGVGDGTQSHAHAEHTPEQSPTHSPGGRPCATPAPESL